MKIFFRWLEKYPWSIRGLLVVSALAFISHLFLMYGASSALGWLACKFEYFRHYDIFWQILLFETLKSLCALLAVVFLLKAWKTGLAEFGLGGKHVLSDILVGAFLTLPAVILIISLEMRWDVSTYTFPENHIFYTMFDCPNYLKFVLMVLNFSMLDPAVFSIFTYTIYKVLKNSTGSAVIAVLLAALFFTEALGVHKLFVYATDVALLIVAHRRNSVVPVIMGNILMLRALFHAYMVV